MNIVILAGRLTKDPELRTTKNETAFNRMTLAVDRPWKSKDGKSQTDFIQVSCWRKLAELCSERLAKGDRVTVQGMIQQSKDRDGNSFLSVTADTVLFPETPRKERSDKGNGPPDEEPPFGDDDIPPGDDSGLPY